MYINIIKIKMEITYLTPKQKSTQIETKKKRAYHYYVYDHFQLECIN